LVLYAHRNWVCLLQYWRIKLHNADVYASCAKLVVGSQALVARCAVQRRAKYSIDLKHRSSLALNALLRCSACTEQGLMPHRLDDALRVVLTPTLCLFTVQNAVCIYLYHQHYADNRTNAIPHKLQARK
jgi:hypothetical protein